MSTHNKCFHGEIIGEYYLAEIVSYLELCIIIIIIGLSGVIMEDIFTWHKSYNKISHKL